MRFFRLTQTMVILIVFIMILVAAPAIVFAQEATNVSGKITATYTEQQEKIEIGDAEGHLMQLVKSEGTNVSTGEAAFMDGAKIVNISYSDVVQGNGSNQGYIIFKNGEDAMYGQWHGKITTTMTTEGTPLTSLVGEYTYINGGGIFEGIEGSGTFKGHFTSDTEYEVEWQGSYTLVK